MPNSIRISAVFPTIPENMYRCWLDSEKHTAMTGEPAQCSAEVGETFMAWDGYITGRNLELEPGKRILQLWRTADFQVNDPNSRLEILMESTPGGTLLTLIHTEIPANQPDYETGWQEFYFEPMLEFFERAY